MLLKFFIHIKLDLHQSKLEVLDYDGPAIKVGFITYMKNVIDMSFKSCSVISTSNRR